jgi:hypothetical protein
MSDTAVIANTVTLGFMITVILAAVFVTTTRMDDTVSVSNTNIANLVIIVGFFMLLIVIAIPFLDINLRLAGNVDTRPDVQSTLKYTIGYTTFAFVIILLISTYLIRKNKMNQQSITFIMICLSMFFSLLTMTLFTLQKMPAAA